jgi:hypothetical protein
MMNPKDLTVDQLSEYIGQYGDSEAFQRGLMKGRKAAKKAARNKRIQAVQRKAFEGGK